MPGDRPGPAQERLLLGGCLCHQAAPRARRQRRPGQHALLQGYGHGAVSRAPHARRQEGAHGPLHGAEPALVQSRVGRLRRAAGPHPRHRHASEQPSVFAHERLQRRGADAREPESRQRIPGQDGAREALQPRDHRAIHGHADTACPGNGPDGPHAAPELHCWTGAALAHARGACKLRESQQEAHGSAVAVLLAPRDRRGGQRARERPVANEDGRCDPERRLAHLHGRLHGLLRDQRPRREAGPPGEEPAAEPARAAARSPGPGHREREHGPPGRRTPAGAGGAEPEPLAQHADRQRRRHLLRQRPAAAAAGRQPQPRCDGRQPRVSGEAGQPGRVAPADHVRGPEGLRLHFVDLESVSG
mmetsp:Transcript_44252/g.102201  ORF Transcript_44252/g.102201 Transcript_44252/m.102201 type:complete len:360 (-) Transcript_44252:142-1221(-)